MANNYIINYFLKDLKEKDQKYLIDMLKDMPQEYIIIFQDYKGDSKSLIKYGLVKDQREFEKLLVTVSSKLQHYNEELDRYSIDKSLRFNICDLSFGFLRFIGYYTKT